MSLISERVNHFFLLPTDSSQRNISSRTPPTATPSGYDVITTRERSYTAPATVYDVVRIKSSRRRKISKGIFVILHCALLYRLFVRCERRQKIDGMTVVQIFARKRLKGVIADVKTWPYIDFRWSTFVKNEERQPSNLS